MSAFVLRARYKCRNDKVAAVMPDRSWYLPQLLGRMIDRGSASLEAGEIRNPSGEIAHPACLHLAPLARLARSMTRWPINRGVRPNFQRVGMVPFRVRR